jgi:hypothetical protein
MNQIAPDVCNTDALHEADIAKRYVVEFYSSTKKLTCLIRAQMVVENAKKLNCDRFVTAADIVNVSRRKAMW